MLCFVYLSICFHSFLFTLKPYKDLYFSILFNKKIKDFQGSKNNFKYFQGHEIGLPKIIQGFSRCIGTLKETLYIAKLPAIAKPAGSKQTQMAFS